MTQLDFLKNLVNKYKFTIKGHENNKQINTQLNPNKQYSYFLIPYTKRTKRTNIYVTKEGKPYLATSFNYTIKNEQTGEYKHVYISQSKILFTTLHQRDLVILDNKNEYDKKLATSLSEYIIVEPKRLPLFFRIDQATFLSDLMKVGYYEV